MGAPGAERLLLPSNVGQWMGMGAPGSDPEWGLKSPPVCLSQVKPGHIRQGTQPISEPPFSHVKNNRADNMGFSRGRDRELDGVSGMA